MRIKLAILAACFIASTMIDGTTPVPQSAPSEVIPVCWEDEVVVSVVRDPYDLVGIGTLGCVPADNLPTTGFRP
jgi:hypothetical protein